MALYWKVEHNTAIEAPSSQFERIRWGSLIGLQQRHNTISMAPRPMCANSGLVLELGQPFSDVALAWRHLACSF